jgi:ubiquinone biosynthesis protein
VAPGIRDVVEADLRCWPAGRSSRRAAGPAPLSPAEVVQQFTVSLRRELDFAAECRNAERIARNFRAVTTS